MLICPLGCAIQEGKILCVISVGFPAPDTEPDIERTLNILAMNDKTYNNSTIYFASNSQQILVLIFLSDTAQDQQSP